MSDSISSKLWFKASSTKAAVSPEDRVERALEKALDNTTAEYAGTPWDSKEPERKNERRGYYIPEGN
jgi:hypothetical protein